VRVPQVEDQSNRRLRVWNLTNVQFWTWHNCKPTSPNVALPVVRVPQVEDHCTGIVDYKWEVWNLTNVQFWTWHNCKTTPLNVALPVVGVPQVGDQWNMKLYVWNLTNVQLWTWHICKRAPLNVALACAPSLINIWRPWDVFSNRRQASKFSAGSGDWS
jgi:hypothetical protein